MVPEGGRSEVALRDPAVDRRRAPDALPYADAMLVIMELSPIATLNKAPRDRDSP